MPLFLSFFSSFIDPRTTLATPKKDKKKKGKRNLIYEQESTEDTHERKNINEERGSK